MNKKEKVEGYELLNNQLKALLSAQNYTLSNLSNATALLNDFLPKQVFVGFYLYNGEQLILGPFQGGVSCVEIKLGAGVCGEAAAKRQTLIVDNVKEHKNYISCDSRAMSEIVVPLIKDGELKGVLDLDAAEPSFYDDIDQKYLEEFCQILSDRTDWRFFE
ncbi:GAF domain-containing protein [Lactococcus ileimucosae]|uniref:GAF domain-containing protein n=1 Tax=Lactococcus ileimucosae TaxID=2941329 RepID=A0ABV4D073_9LACT|nr:GAF domain-containing protein [Lactococcus ileimucosae]